jgi:hypothetical protein
MRIARFIFLCLALVTVPALAVKAEGPADNKIVSTTKPDQCSVPSTFHCPPTPPAEEQYLKAWGMVAFGRRAADPETGLRCECPDTTAQVLQRPKPPKRNRTHRAS